MEAKPISRLLLALLAGALFLCVGPLSSVLAEEAAPANEVIIKLDGKVLKMKAPPLIRDGRWFVPAARMAAKLGAASSWDDDNEEVTIRTALQDKIVLGNGVPVVYFNEGRYRLDAVPFMENGSLYAPMRQLAEMLHANVTVNGETGVVDLETVQPAVITAGNGLDEIGKQFGSKRSELLKRNGLGDKEALPVGTKLKVVIPSIWNQAAEPFTDSDLLLLAKITMVEAGYEPFQGQLAVANVILNRVKDSKFPDTIHDVIYAGKQFPPAHNGLLDKSKPNANALRAAKNALNGRNNVDNALYFFDPDVSSGPFWSSLDVIVTIGHHRFAR